MCAGEMGGERAGLFPIEARPAAARTAHAAIHVLARVQVTARGFVVSMSWRVALVSALQRSRTRPVRPLTRCERLAGAQTHGRHCDL